MTISEYSVKRPITVLMATISVLVLGYISLGRLPLTLLPEFASPNLAVFVSYPSSSPEEVQRNITRPLEEYLSTLNALEKIQSTSSSSGANVRLEFKQGTDMDMASLDVRDRIDQVRNQLPTDVERVSIRRWQTTDMPVFRFAVAWDGEKDELYRMTEDLLRPRLERIDGVANVEVRGVEARQVIVELDERRLEAHGIDVFNLGQALRAGNVNLSGGYIIEGERKYSLRTVGEFQTAEDIAGLPLLGGRLVLSDVAVVRYDFPEQTNFSRLNGNEAVTVSVFKASTANVVRVCEAVRLELEEIEMLPALAGRLGVRVFQDQAEPILSTLNNLKTAGVYGGALAMLVLFLFLMKFRSTLIISLAIPVSIVFTFAFMYLLRVLAGSDISLNTISLMGLMVAVGMLVDNSVVVLENIFRHKQEKGLSAMEAAIKGSREVGMAVLASTATTVVVFASFVFLPNAISGRWNKDFGMAVAVSLVASLIVALTLIPLISSRLFTGREKPKQKIIRWLTEVYGSLMRVVLRWRFVALIVMAGLGYSSYALFNSIDREFMPSVAEREVRFNILVERTFSLAEMNELFTQLENLLLERREELEIESISTGFNARTTSRGQYRGDLNILLRSEGETTPTAALRDRMMALFPRLPGVEYRPGRMRHFGGGGEMGVSVELRGEDGAMLALYAEEIKERISRIPGLNTVQTSLEMGDDEIHLSVDRERLEKFGISSLAVARAVSSALSTRATTRLKGDSGEIDVILQLRGADQFSLTELLNMSMENRQGELIPLHSIVDFQYSRGPISIRREDRKAIINVSADTDRGGTFFVSQQVQESVGRVGAAARLQRADGPELASGPTERGGEPLRHRSRPHPDVHHHGRPVRELFAPADHPLHGSLFDHRSRPGLLPDRNLAEPDGLSRDPGPVRDRGQQRDHPGGPHQQSATRGAVPRRSDRPGRNGPASPDSDDGLHLDIRPAPPQPSLPFPERLSGRGWEGRHVGAGEPGGSRGADHLHLSDADYPAVGIFLHGRPQSRRVLAGHSGGESDSLPARGVGAGKRPEERPLGAVIRGVDRGKTPGFGIPATG
jgi:hydrophobic/amphiphilic exporter-1 (mainly G- bacteria), HAE1 family